MVTYLFVTSVRLFVRQQLQSRRLWETVIPFMDLNYRRLITKTQRSGRRLCFHLHMFETNLTGSPNLLWQRATPAILGWFAGRKWKNNSKGIPNCLNHCVIFIVHTRFTNVAAGRIIQPAGPRFGEPCLRTSWSQWLTHWMTTAQPATETFFVCFIYKSTMDKARKKEIVWNYTPHI